MNATRPACTGPPRGASSAPGTSSAWRRRSGSWGESLIASGKGRVRINNERLYRQPTGGGHIMGTTRMGTSQSNSVVDRDCRVHGYDNLFVAGSSVFPTGGYVNPTLTILALALRLADTLATAG